MKPIKILIAGLGGVGGYYGAMLARYYTGRQAVQIGFLARGEHKDAIRQGGLRIFDRGVEWCATPHMLSDNPADFGVADYVILATKSYDMAAVIELLKPAIGHNTVVLPLLNGATISRQIQKLLPQSVVWSGCTYIVAAKSAPGIITNSGPTELICFGSLTPDPRVQELYKLMADASIDVKSSDQIQTPIWEKFLFISVAATLTTYFNTTYGGLRSTPEYMTLFEQLVRELIPIARADGAAVGEEMVVRTIRWLNRVPAEKTTSMHNDALRHHITEVDNLTGSVVQLAQQYGIDAPHYTHIYQALKRVHP